MSETKWPAGPWEKNPWTEMVIQQAGTGRGIASISYQESKNMERIYEENRAIAQLVCAAPDLYWQLRHLVRHLEEHDGHLGAQGMDTLSAARAALARARGEEAGRG